MHYTWRKAAPVTEPEVAEAAAGWAALEVLPASFGSEFGAGRRLSLARRLWGRLITGFSDRARVAAMVRRR